MKFAIIRERKNPPDRRVVFSPTELVKVKKQFPEAEFKIESSEIRVFSDKAYKNKGFEVTENVSDCDRLLNEYKAQLCLLQSYSSLPKICEAYDTNTYLVQSFCMRYTFLISDLGEIVNKLEFFCHESTSLCSDKTDSEASRRAEIRRICGSHIRGVQEFG